MNIKKLSDLLVTNDCSLFPKEIKYGYVVLTKTATTKKITSDRMFIALYRRNGDMFFFIDSFFMSEAEFMIKICLERGIGSSEIAKINK